MDKKFKKILDSNTNNSENFKKVMGALDGARAILNESITPELKKEMTGAGFRIESVTDHEMMTAVYPETRDLRILKKGAKQS